MKGVNQAFFDFIDSNKDLSAEYLRLKNYGKYFGFDVNLAIDQIEARRKYAKKLPRNVANPYFLFPTLLSGEQATSEVIADFHASLIENGVNSILDMTAGLGIDAVRLSSKCSDIIAIDIDQVKTECLEHNKRILGIGNMTVICDDSLRFLQDTQRLFDYIFVDPARRSSSNSRTYAFKDCSPDIVTHHNLIRQKCRKLLIKASPMLDISESIKELGGVSELWVLSLKNECKELFIKQDFDSDLSPDPCINAINILNNGQISNLKFRLSETKTIQSDYVDDQDIIRMKYLYEPNASLMKSLAWNVAGNRYTGLKKASLDTHVFLSDKLYHNFPGRIFHIEQLLSSKETKKLKGTDCNIVARNYICTASELRKRLKTKDGGDNFIYAMRLGNKNRPAMLMCTRISD